jgi:hypothetical protein
VHAVPHAPQLFSSFVRSTQVPLQSVRPVGQVQVPAWHILPPEHLLPHAPQLSLSVWRLTQTPGQQLSPVGQAQQVPAMHGSPAGHLLPQAPQWLGSVFRFTHWPEQSVSPETHEQVPFWQVSPLAVSHLTPQAPQWSLLDRRSVQRQLPQLAPQLVRGVAQEQQLPLLQGSPGPQSHPHAPQLCGSLAVLTQIPPQSVWPAGQTHLPATHSLPPVQALPHFPQCWLLDWRSKIPPAQLAMPGGSTQSVAHPPSMQQEPGKLQPLPQAPQLSGSVDVSTHLPAQYVRPAGHPRSTLASATSPSSATGRPEPQAPKAISTTARVPRMTPPGVL